MGRRNNSHKSEPSFLQRNPEYQLHYIDFNKTAKTWQDSGQYWISREYYKRASCLLRGDILNGMLPVKTEQFIYNKNNGSIGGKYFIGDSNVV
jgi:hypothetical protein